MGINIPISCYQESDSDVSWPLGAGTVCYWFEMRQDTGWKDVVSIDANGWAVAQDADAPFLSAYGNNSYISQGIPGRDELHHYASTYDTVSGDRETWQDGVSIATASDAADSYLDTAGPLRLAYHWFLCRLHDVRIYNRVLSDVEIRGIYRARGRDANVAGLVYNWKLNEGHTGKSTVIDGGDLIGQTGGVPISATTLALDWQNADDIGSRRRRAG